MRYSILKLLTLYIVLFCFSSCEDDRVEVESGAVTSNLVSMVSDVDGDEVSHILDFIQSRSNRNLQFIIDDTGSPTGIHRSHEDNLILTTVLTEQIKQVTDSEGRSNYSFKMSREEADGEVYFLNLVVKEYGSEMYMFIVKYVPNDTWSFNNEIQNFAGFSGDIYFYDENGIYKSKLEMELGTSISFERNEDCPNNGDSTTSGGGGGSVDDGPGGGDSGGGGPGGGGGGSPGGGGGGNDVVDIICTCAGHGWMDVLSGLCTCESFVFVYADGSTGPVDQKSSTRDFIDCPDIVSCNDAVGDPCDCNVAGDGCADIPDGNDDIIINIGVFIDLEFISALNEYLEPDLTQEQIDWIFESAANVEAATVILEYLESNNSLVDIDFASNLIISLITENYSSTIFEINDYPGLDSGFPFKWWEDSNYILNSGNFDMPSEELNAPDETPNAQELALFRLYPFEAFSHIGNSNAAMDTALQLASDNEFNQTVLKSINNGKGDAFRHSFWNALGTADFGSTIMKKFADAHEFGQSGLDVNMDLFNNQIGRDISNSNNYTNNTSDVLIQNDILDNLEIGLFLYAHPTAINGGIISDTSLIPTNQ